MTAFRGLFIVVLVLTMVGGVGLVLAAPSPQGAPALPTATFYPPEPNAYSIETARGSAVPLVVPGETIGGVTFSDTTVTNQYPLGLVFTSIVENPESANSIRLVTYGVEGDVTARTPVEFGGDDLRTITATIWDDTPAPVWTQFGFAWEVITDDGGIDGTRHDHTYEDPTRDWIRVESPPITFYWFDIDGRETDEFAQILATNISQTFPRLERAFGGSISPDWNWTIVMYPDQAAYDAVYGGGFVNFVNNYRIFDSHASIGLGNQCPYFVPLEQRDQAWSLGFVMTNGAVQRMIQEFQREHSPATVVGWWFAGQSVWFREGPIPYNLRLQDLAFFGYQLPPMHDANGYPVINFPDVDDDCGNVIDHVGASFVNWFVLTFGIDAHADVMANMRSGLELLEALETVTGSRFIDLENAWRSTVGFAPITEADVDPTLALGPAVAPTYFAGDRFQMPGIGVIGLRELPGDLAGPIVCLAGTEVEVLRVGSLDGFDWYELDCAGSVGWYPETDLRQ